MFVLSITLLLAIYLVLLSIKINKSLQYWKVRNIPHAKLWSGFPFKPSILFGNSHFERLLQDVYKKYSMHRVCGLYDYLEPVLVVNDIHLIERICVKDFDKFSEHSNTLPKSIATPWMDGSLDETGKDWHKLRKATSPVYSNKRLKVMFELMTHYAKELPNYLQNDKTNVTIFETRSTFMKVMNDIIASCMFGIECNSFTNPNNKIFQNLGRLYSFTTFNTFQLMKTRIRLLLMKIQKLHFLKVVLADIIQFRERSGLMQSDMMYFLKEAQKSRLQKHVDSYKETKNADINEEDILYRTAGISVLLFHSVFATLEAVVQELAAHADIQEKLINEVDQTLKACNGEITFDVLMQMKYLNMVICETLRKRTSGYLDRRCLKTITIEPVLPGEKSLIIEEGMVCVIPVSHIHKDPKYFPNPEKFDPERFNVENKDKLKSCTFIPFGVGPRMCVGTRLVLLLTKVIIFSLLAKFEIISIQKIGSHRTVPRSDYDHLLGLKRRSNSC